MVFDFPKVYPLTDVTLTGLSHAEQVRRLAAGGAKVVQLREKRMTGQDFYAEAQAALKTAHENGVKLIINDRVDVAMAVGADGVHLGREDLPTTAARQLLGPRAIIGVSTHNLYQAINAQSLPVNYLAIGPIFSTTSKNDTAPELGLAGLRQVRNAVVGLPLVAIGGITEFNARDVIAAGADSLAVISSLLADSESITKRTAELIQLLQTR